jgi:hypothetical protein
VAPLVSINPTAGTTPIQGGGFEQAFATIAGQTARLAQRVATLEATRGSMAPNSIQSDFIGPAQINGTHIAPASITTASIVAGSIDASVINAISIAAAVGEFISIDAGQITAGDITADHMTAHLLEAAQAAIGTLSSITANMGAITAGNITGATVQTGASGARTIMDSSGLRGFALDGVTKVFEISTATGLASFTGIANIDPASVIPGPALNAALFGGGNMLTNSSFEQRSQPGSSTDKRTEGYGATNATIAGSTLYSYDGDNSAEITCSTSSTDFFMGRRNIYDDTALVPIKPGRPYTLSAWVYTPAGGTPRNVKFFTYFYKTDKTGSTITTPQDGLNVNGVPVTGAKVLTVAGSWTRYTWTTPAAPSDAAWLGFVVWFQGATTGAVAGEKHYVDAIQVEQGDVPSSYAPKPNEILYAQISALNIQAGAVTANSIAAGAVQAQHITVAFGGPNRLTNPTFANNTIALNTNGNVPGWDVRSNTTTQRTQAQFNNASSDVNSMKVTASATGTVSVTSNPATILLNAAGQKYTFSGYFRNGTGARDITASITFYDSANTVLSYITGETGQVTVPAPGSGWARFKVTATAPPNTDHATVTFALLGAAVNDFHYLDDTQFELGGDASPFGPNPNEVLPGSIGSTQIAPDSITSDKILAGSIVSSDITTSGLTAILINSSTITGGTITGATVQTATSGARAVMDSSGFTYYSSGGTALFDASGGSVTMTGTLNASGISFTNVATPGNTGAASNSVRFYHGNFTLMTGYISSYSNGSTYSVQRACARAVGASGNITEWSAFCEDLAGSQDSRLAIVGQNYGYSTGASFRIIWTLLPSLDVTLFTVDHNRAVQFFGDIFIDNPSSPLSNNYVWFMRATYMNMHEDFGLAFDGGNYTTMHYGGEGAFHYVSDTSGTGTGGSSLSLGYSYALVHVDNSDSKIKYDIREVPEFAALSRIRALRPVRWAFKGGPGTGANVQGFLAEEVAEVIPEAVEKTVNMETGEEHHYIHPTAIIAQLVMAVQELSETVNILRGEKPDAPLRRDLVSKIK